MRKARRRTGATAEAEPHAVDGRAAPSQLVLQVMDRVETPREAPNSLPDGAPSNGPGDPRSNGHQKAKRLEEQTLRHGDGQVSGRRQAEEEAPDGSEAAGPEDPKRPAFTDRALRTLERYLAKLDKRVRKQARVDARRQNLVHIDEPHVVNAWRVSLPRANATQKKLSWISGVVSGCLFSFIVAVFSRDDAPSMEVSIALLLLFSATLVVGWSTTR